MSCVYFKWPLPLRNTAQWTILLSILKNHIYWYSHEYRMLLNWECQRRALCCSLEGSVIWIPNLCQSHSASGLCSRGSNLSLSGTCPTWTPWNPSETCMLSPQGCGCQETLSWQSAQQSSGSRGRTAHPSSTTVRVVLPFTAHPQSFQSGLEGKSSINDGNCNCCTADGLFRLLHTG